MVGPPRWPRDEQAGPTHERPARPGRGAEHQRPARTTAPVRHPARDVRPVDDDAAWPGPGAGGGAGARGGRPPAGHARRAASTAAPPRPAGPAIATSGRRRTRRRRRSPRRAARRSCGCLPSLGEGGGRPGPRHRRPGRLDRDTANQLRCCVAAPLVNPGTGTESPSRLRARPGRDVGPSALRIGTVQHRRVPLGARCVRVRVPPWCSARRRRLSRPLRRPVSGTPTPSSTAWRVSAAGPASTSTSVELAWAWRATLLNASRSTASRSSTTPAGSVSSSNPLNRSTGSRPSAGVTSATTPSSRARTPSGASWEVWWSWKIDVRIWLIVRQSTTSSSHVINWPVACARFHRGRPARPPGTPRASGPCWHPRASGTRCRGARLPPIRPRPVPRWPGSRRPWPAPERRGRRPLRRLRRLPAAPECRRGTPPTRARPGPGRGGHLLARHPRRGIGAR